jgi:hypothetical protein
MCALYRLHPPFGYVAQPTNHSSLGFEAQTKKLSRRFFVPNHQTAATGFEAQTGKPIDLGFVAEPRNPRSASPCAQCRPHTASPDISIVQPPSTRHVLDHVQSSTPSLLLLPRSSSLPAMSHLSPTHPKTSKCDSPYEIEWDRITETSRIRIQTTASQ